MNRQTYHAKPSIVDRRWYIADATDQVLGRLSVQLAIVLMGKHKPEYTPHCDVGDFIVVTNAEKMKLTGSKLDTKFFQTYSGHPSGQKAHSYRRMIEHNPEKLLKRSVGRMLPKNRLARRQLLKLKVYRGSEHPHQAQVPTPLPT